MAAIPRPLNAVTWLLTFMVAGCSHETTTVQVSGKVTYKNTAIGNGTISFFPEKGRFVAGIISSDGSFSTQLPPGKYRVTIVETIPLPENWKHGDPLPTAKPKLPAKFGSVKTSGLMAEVGPETGTLALDFPLQ